MTTRLALAALLLVATSSLAKKPEERPEPLWRQALQVTPLAIVGGTIHPVTSPVVERGTLLLENGTIRAILREGAPVPAGHEVIDARGLHVYPGLVAASAVGLGLTADGYTGGVDAILGRPVADSFDPFASDVELAASAGITSAVVWAEGFQTRGPFLGRGALLKMSVKEPRGLVVRDPVALRASPSILTPGTRRDLEAVLQNLRESKARDARDARSPDPLKELARRRIPVVASPGDPGSILSLAELSDTLDVDVVIALSFDAWEVADRLDDVGASVIQHVRPTWGTPRGDRRASLSGGWNPRAATLLTRAGVPTAVCPYTDIIRIWGVGGRDLLDLPMEAAFAQREGLSADEALAAITIVPARLFGADDRIGSLEPGKDADVVLADGDLLDYRTFVRKTIVNGRVAYDGATSRHWKNVLALRDGKLTPEPPKASPAEGGAALPATPQPPTPTPNPTPTPTPTPAPPPAPPGGP